MSPIINHYEFGKIEIDDKIYTSDLKIICGKIVPNWWRKEGHNLCLEDINDVLSYNPEKIIVGCGTSSAMKVENEVIQYCRKNNIDLLILDTYEAVSYFNKLTPLGKPRRYKSLTNYEQ
ncbi:MAG: MTH938/NDUFAF3 family protein [Endomicrobia bacterium]|nr:MTH938/NDUFAF3 family protein [Endomicrobiia bacterium]